jgi:hypothetical protein
MSTLSDVSQSNLGWVYPPQPQTEINIIDEVDGIINGITALVEDQGYVDVVFGEQPSANWVLIEASIFNLSDSTPLNVWPGVLTSKTTTGFRLQLNGTPDSGNYYLTWSIKGVFGYTLSGPSSGRKNVASSPFTVSLPNDATTSGTVVITPSDGGAGGTFTPSTVSLTVAAPSATFTYTPSTYGARTISTSNDRGLTDPAQIAFTSTVDTYTLSGPSSGTEGQPSTDFTVALPVGGAVIGTVTVTPDDGGDGGTFNPTTVELTTLAPSATFTYTPASVGAKTISVTNDGGLTNPANLTYTASAASHLLSSLISYWKLDEASGTRADSHGTNDLTDAVSTASAAGKINNAADLERGDGDYLYIGDNASISTGDIDFTFSIWVKVESLPGGGNLYAIISQDDWSGFTDRAHLLYLDGTSNKIIWDVFGAAGSIGQVTANNFGALTTGVWYHIVCWHDAVNNQVGIKINDGTADTVATTGAAANSAKRFILGTGDGSAAPNYDGLLDECGFWKRILTAGEKTALYNGGSGLPYSSFTA